MTRPPAEEGGGASRSTDPARGSSSATDVSLREYLGSRMESLDRHITSEIAALRRETQAANMNAEKAIEVAAHEAEERLTAHNGLIEQMREQAGTFATRTALEDFKTNVTGTLDERRSSIDTRVGRVEASMSRLYGGLAVVAFVGVANLVKVWTG